MSYFYILDKLFILFYNVFEKLKWYVVAKHYYEILILYRKSCLIDSYKITHLRAKVDFNVMAKIAENMNWAMTIFDLVPEVLSEVVPAFKLLLN